MQNRIDVICDWFPGLLLAAGGSGRGGSRSVGRGCAGASTLGFELAAAPRIGRLGTRSAPQRVPSVPICSLVSRRAPAPPHVYSPATKAGRQIGRLGKRTAPQLVPSFPIFVLVSGRALENRRLRKHNGPITKAPFGGGREHRKKRYKFRATLQCGVAASVIVLERSPPPNTASPKGSPIDVLAPSRCASICPPLEKSSGE